MENKRRDIKIEIKNTTKIPDEYKEQLFKIEYDTFGNIYKNCPKNLEEFDKRYLNKKLVLVLCFKEHEIIAHRTYEIINNNQVQSMFMVVKEKYRNNQLSNLICSVSVDYFKWLGFQYITSWTRVDITAAKIMAKYALFLSEKDDFNEKEAGLLRNLEKYWGRTTNCFGMKRRVRGFYKMVNDKQCGDANFWVHRLQ